eukprot:6986614-Lingulodinium_polyedra.AAC.1
MARGGYLRTLDQVVSVLYDPDRLAWMGLDTVFSQVPEALTLRSGRVLAEDAFAEEALGLAVELLFERGSSMSWHSDDYP